MCPSLSKNELKFALSLHQWKIYNFKIYILHIWNMQDDFIVLGLYNLRLTINFKADDGLNFRFVAQMV